MAYAELLCLLEEEVGVTLREHVGLLNQIRNIPKLETEGDIGD